jgi:hypothetical protein
MKFLTRLLVLIYVTLVMFLGVIMVLFVLHKINFENVVDILFWIYRDVMLRKIFGGIGGFLLLINFIVYGFLGVRRQQDKIIAFDNPAGRVKVSLTALEDLIRRRVESMPEIKEAKILIRAFRGRITAKVYLSLRAEVNIPDLTSRVQELVKNKVQDTVGVEEKIVVSVEVGRIIPDKIKDQPAAQRAPADGSERNFPFRGYRA